MQEEVLQALVVGYLQRGTINNAWFFVFVSIFLAILLFSAINMYYLYNFKEFLKK